MMNMMQLMIMMTIACSTPNKASNGTSSHTHIKSNGSVVKIKYAEICCLDCFTCGSASQSIYIKYTSPSAHVQVEHK